MVNIVSGGVATTVDAVRMLLKHALRQRQFLPSFTHENSSLVGMGGEGGKPHI
jgi:hypothetical protein